jgi:hypothetical protein
MGNKQPAELKSEYTYVKDADGVLYICKIKDLKKEDALTEEEKASCMIPPGDA